MVASLPTLRSGLVRVALLFVLVAIVGGCATVARLQPHRVTAEGAGVVTVFDPRNVVLSISTALASSAPDASLAVSNPEGNEHRLAIDWISATCSPGGVFELRRLAGAWALEQLNAAAPPQPAASGPAPSCAGGPLHLRAELMLKVAIEASKVKLVPPQ